jgi:hypothetical protein
LVGRRTYRKNMIREKIISIIGITMLTILVDDEVVVVYVVPFSLRKIFAMKMDSGGGTDVVSCWRLVYIFALDSASVFGKQLFTPDKF